MLMNWLLMKLTNPAMDDTVKKMFTEGYSDNLFLMVTAAEKISPKAMIESAMRAESGKELARPLGSPVVLSPWDKILLNPKQLFQLPNEDYTMINTQTVIGPNAKKPLILDIPIMITGMSYGGSLSLPMKMALAKGAAMAGTSTNTGESAVTNEERDSAKFLIGQYHRGGQLSGPEQLSRLDAIEIQLGQGAWGGAVDEPMLAKDIGSHLRKAWHLEKGQDATVYARMPGKSTTQDYIDMINTMKEQYDVPVGVKIAGTDYIEYELAVIAKTQADYIVIDGSEGGTASSNPTLQDNVGLPTLHTLVRTVAWLTKQGLREKFSIIVAGGMSTPGHFLKALALGADAIYIGTVALLAAMHTQITKVLPQSPPSQLALYTGKMTDKLDIDMAADHLAKFLNSCTLEMQLAIQAVGKSSTKELNSSDLVTVDKDLAEFMGIRYAATPRHSKEDLKQENVMKKEKKNNKSFFHLQ
ncbi:MAG: gltB [Firmicutes bacterium]|nr:gltB [Bacillota bacterium]